MKQINILKNIEDVKDFILGTTILATGGGGSPDLGYELLKDIYNNISFISVSDLTDDDFVVSPYFVGSMGSLEERSQQETVALVKKAFHLLERRMEKRITAIVASEIGGGNTSIALFVASLLNVPVVDGDLMGRAGPELHQSTAHIFGKPVTPSVIVTKTGNSLLIENTASIDDYENIARFVSYLSKGSGFVIDTPLNGKDAREVVIEGTLTLCLELGRTVRRCIEENLDPIHELLKLLKGYKIFEGVVKMVDLQNTGKFLEGNVVLENKSSELTIYVKNEYIFASINGKPIVMPPDLIVLLKENGQPLLTNRLKINEYVHIIASPSPKVWRSSKGLELFGPRHFGFDFDFIPVEVLV